MQDRKRIASVALFVILLAVTIAIVAFVMANGSTPIGPSIPTSNSLDILQDGTIVASNIDFVNVTGDGTVTAVLTGAELNISGGGGGGSSIEGLNNLTPVVPTIAAINAGIGITGVDSGGGIYTLDSITPTPQPTSTPQPTPTPQPTATPGAGGGGERNRAWDRRNSGSGQQHVAGCVNACITTRPTTVGDFQNKIIYVPFFVGDDVDTDEFRVHVYTAGSSSERARIGLYDSTTDPIAPNDLVIDGGSFLIDSTGDKSISIASTGLTANRLYWVAIVTESATVQFDSLSDEENIWAIPLGVAGFGGLYSGRTHSFTCGAACTNSLPTTASGTSGKVASGASGYAPLMQLILN